MGIHKGTCTNTKKKKKRLINDIHPHAHKQRRNNLSGKSKAQGSKIAPAEVDFWQAGSRFLEKIFLRLIERVSYILGLVEISV